MALPEPKLDEAVAALVAEGARFVVIGGFAVIANRFVRATEDVDFLVPDDDSNDLHVLAALRKLDGVRFRDGEPLLDEHLLGQAHLRAATRAGVVDVMRGGLPPLDFDTVADEAMNLDETDPDRHSDIDLIVIAQGGKARHDATVYDVAYGVALEEGDNPASYSIFVHGPDWLRGRRAIESFFIQEVDRDKIVLAGSDLEGEEYR